MSDAGAPAHSSPPIGVIANPPFVRLPDPTVHFRQRAQRFALLSQGHDLEPYLRFMAGLAEAQHQCQSDLPEPEMPTAEVRERARGFAMPPLDRGNFTADQALEVTFDRLFALAAGIEMPAQARLALEQVSRLDAAGRVALADDVLAGATAADGLAERVYVAAALQVHVARLATRLDAKRLVPVGEGACPCCGSAPVSSLVVDWTGAHNTRFCACWLCATLWHVVRVKCTLCGSTKGITYHEIEAGPGAGLVRAETCESCGSYAKILLQHADPALDPVADDVATLGLDLLVRDAGYRRGAVNPYLVGY
ncbi:formate dehydrogenase accessory protein FdhE [Bradyrhizobium prioriisuperbiae]|uniref:formate dehydrogenase accessory protein FdhE n=1 Tax=Bradyrhizobium prioriisuperbiae TaxID=2854389 RepID=UPI0028E43F8D|nr:formate dehydrogenase accessory protein FdhE [Bradyrhizobium prioritasuperba]